MQGIEQASDTSMGALLLSGNSAQRFLHVGLDGGLVFGERQLAANIRIHVAVGDMMRDLAQRPAAVAVGSVELRIGKAAQVRRASGREPVQC